MHLSSSQAISPLPFQCLTICPSITIENKKETQIPPVLQGGTQPASNSAAAEEMNMVLQQASHLLGCDAAGIVPAVQHMQTRLQRFNGLLPKYQQVLSQVYEALRISSLDEVVPAMERLMNESC